MGSDTHKVGPRPEIKTPELDGEEQQSRSFTLWWLAIVAGLAIVAIVLSLLF